MKILWLGWEDTYTPHRMMDAARRLGIDLMTVDIVDIDFAVANGVTGAFHRDQNIVDQYDAMVARSFYPYISETLTIARLFNDAGKVVIDQSLTDEGFVVSKMHDYTILSQYLVPVPQTWQIFDAQRLENIASKLGYPCVLKGVHGSHGTHVHLLNTVDQLRQRLSTYPRGELLLQEYLPADQDYRILVIGYKALPIIVGRSPAPGEFRTNVGYSQSGSSHSIEAFPGFQATAEQAARVLRREFAGVDIRYSKGGPVVLEVNRRPTFENFEHVTGLDVAGLFLDYAANRVKHTAQHLYGCVADRD